MSKRELILNRQTVFGRDDSYSDSIDELFDKDLLKTILLRVSKENIKRLDLSNYRSFLEPEATECLEIIGEFCPNLEAICFNGLLKKDNFQSLYADSFGLFAQSCSNLHDVDLSLSSIDDQSLVVLFRSCQKLDSLNISFCSLITGQCFESLGEICFHRLQIEECSQLKNEYLMLVLRQSRNSIRHLSLNNQLVSIDIIYFILYDLIKLAYLEMKVVGFEALASTSVHKFNEFRFLKALTSLDLSYSWCDDRILAYILCHCQSLTSLVLNNCGNVSDETFTRMPIRAPLEKLNLFSLTITDVSLNSIVDQLYGSIKWLKLMGCIELSSEAMVNALQNLESLEYFDIRYTAADNLIIEKAIELDLSSRPHVFILCQGSAVCVDDEPYKSYPFQKKTVEHFFRNYVILKHNHLEIQADTIKEVDE